VQPNEVLRDGEAEPEAARRRCGARARLAEPVEDVRQEGGVDAAARVGDGDDGPAVVRLDADVDATAARRELHGVGEHVHDHLLQTRGIAVDDHGRRAGRAREHDAAGVGDRPHGLGGRGHHGPHVERRHVELELAGDDARDVEQLVDELPLQPRVALDHVERLLALAGADPAGAQHAGPPEDRRQRRAQLVR
jgi:hypothetical protein